MCAAAKSNQFNFLNIISNFAALIALLKLNQKNEKVICNSYFNGWHIIANKCPG